MTNEWPKSLISEKVKKPEKEKLPSKEVWIVDDEPEIIKSLIRFWKGKISEVGYTIKHFEKAKDALDEINRRKAAEENMPKVIFVDGELNKDEEDLKKGSNFIKKIHKIEDIETPKLVAHSSMKEFNDEMLESGADIAFSKNDVKSSRDFLLDLEDKSR